MIHDVTEEELEGIQEMVASMSGTIGDALDYLDWLAAIVEDETFTPYIEQLYKILDGQEVEH